MILPKKTEQGGRAYLKNPMEEQAVSILAGNPELSGFNNFNPNQDIPAHVVQKTLQPASFTTTNNSQIVNYLILINNKLVAECSTQSETEEDLDKILQANPSLSIDNIQVWQRVNVKAGVFLDL